MRHIEHRFAPVASAGSVGITARAGEGKMTATLTGMAAVFFDPADPEGTTYKLYDGLVERINPQAFTRALRERQDVAGLFSHDPRLVLGRVSSGTMRLSVDKNGLRYEIDTPDTTVGRDVLEMVKRKDVAGSSFSFLVTEQRFIVGQAGESDIREILDCDVQDVGPCVFP